MSKDNYVKLIPRNMPAKSKKISTLPVGNPASSRLESGVGNCFPGLEVDLRNLERRFFPYLVVEFALDRPAILIVEVDLTSVYSNISELTEDAIKTYRSLSDYAKVGLYWEIQIINADFGEYGKSIEIGKISFEDPIDPKLPPSPWTAIRMLRQGQAIELTLLAPDNKTVILEGSRVGYFSPDGALADMFEPGEMSQSLCSPWTHDFRDCGCFYWASNHPDIVQPPVENIDPSPAWNKQVNWQRSSRIIDDLPSSASANESPRPNEMGYYEINNRWQALNFVIGGREIIDQVKFGDHSGTAYLTLKELVDALNYAAGVELAVMHEYLAAAYSLEDPENITSNLELKNDLIAAFAEIIRIAMGEMRHLRAVNSVLKEIQINSDYSPALRVATKLPTSDPKTFRTVTIQAVTEESLNFFIEIERAAASVDHLYRDILATLKIMGTENQVQAIATIMSEGEDHYQTFKDIREWLIRHPPLKIIRQAEMKIAPANNPTQEKIDSIYLEILNSLHFGYSSNLLDGATYINKARELMVGQNGLQQFANDMAKQGYLVSFNKINDERFSPLP